MKIYVLYIEGTPYAFYSSKKEAIKVGREIADPTSEDGEGNEYIEFEIEEWTEGEDTQDCKSWSYEYKLVSVKPFDGD